MFPLCLSIFVSFRYFYQCIDIHSRPVPSFPDMVPSDYLAVSFFIEYTYGHRLS